MRDEMNERPQTPPPASRTLALVALGLVAGVGGTLLLRPAAQAPATAPAPAPKKQMYQCPMHPQIIQDHEGDCPICGMKLVPIEEGGTEASGGGGGLKGEGPAVEGHAVVTIDPERQQLIGLKTARVAVGAVSGEIRATARLAVDETRVRKVNVKVEGFVEKLFVDFTGKAVAKGQPLFSLYSPEFVSAQKEYLLAIKTQKALASGSLSGSGGELLEAARRRLTLWDIPKETLEHLETSGEIQKALILRSPISGVVTVKNVVEGTRLTPADIPYEITDLSRVWALADVYEQELGAVKAGQAATLTLPAFPGKAFNGRVIFVDPILDPKTRTAKVRLEFPNPHGDLRPELFGEALLKGPGHKGILVPLDAVLDSGTRKVVFIALGEGRFEPREVTTGVTVGEQVEVLTGLRPGEGVIVGANFLVDSESRLRSALAVLARKRGSAPVAAPSGHQH